MVKTPINSTPIRAIAVCFATALKRGLRSSFAAALILHFTAPAAEPLCWERAPNRPAPAQFDTYHGQSLDFRCTFTGFGALPFAEGADVRLWYQTNGMGTAWWSIPATVSSNMLAATFTPSADPGAERLTVFFGAPSNAYAAAQVRFRNSPGATPNHLDPPSVLDWQAELSAATNALGKSSAAHWQEIDLRFETTPTLRDISLIEDKILDVRSGLETNVAHIVTNTVTLTAPMRLDGLWLADGGAGDYQTDAAIIDYAANTVSWKVLDGGDGWFVSWNYAAGTLFDPATDTYSYGVKEMPLGGYWDGSVWVDDYVDVGPISYTSSTQTVSVTRNALGLARRQDITNIVTKPFVEGLGIKSGIQEETDPIWAAEKSGYARSSDVTQIQNSVNTMWATMYGESVWLAVTNYMRQIAGTVPSLRMWEVRDGGTNLVYSSAEEIEHVAAQKMNEAKSEIEKKIPRKAWGSYQSSGEDNPSSNAVTVVNSSRIMLTGGGEWYRTIETGGASVWVLRTGGLMTVGGDTNGNFKVCDAEGNAQIEVFKTSDQTVDAIVSDTDFDLYGNFTVTFNASGSNHPIVSCAVDLGADFIEEENGEINALGITVTWAQNGDNLWVATIHQDNRSSQLFLYGKVKVAGVNVVRNNAPTALEGGIYLNNVRYRIVPYTTGGKTYMTLEAWQ